MDSIHSEQNDNDEIKAPTQAFQGDAIQMQGKQEIDTKELANNPFIYSLKESVQKNSFIDSRQPFDAQCPPPRYFTEEELLHPLPTEKEEIFKGLQEEAIGHLVCVDKEMMDKQKGVLVDVLKQLTVNLLKGLTIAHISLPVKIFEPRSALQRIVDLFSFAPKFLTQAANTEDHMERLKLVITNAVSSIYLCCSQNKPFNPILGETLQAEFPDGTEIYCEHTSHHPPVSNFYMHPKDKDYEFWGFYEIVGQMSGNSMRASQKGPNHIRFKDGHHIRYQLVDYKLGGTVMGERTIEAIGNMIFEDLTNNVKAVICFNTYKKTGWWTKTVSGKKDEFMGIIYKTQQPIDEKQSFKQYYVKGTKDIKDLANIQSEIGEKICDIHGYLFKEIQIGDKVYWNIDEETPVRQLPMTEKSGQLVLPSDWRYREDLIWLKYNNIPIAHNWKVRMEVQQRYDRRMRQQKGNSKSSGH